MPPGAAVAAAPVPLQSGHDAFGGRDIPERCLGSRIRAMQRRKTVLTSADTFFWGSLPAACACQG